MELPPDKSFYFQPYERRTLFRNERFGWRLRASNGKIEASAEKYKNRGDRDEIVGKMSAESGWPIDVSK